MSISGEHNLKYASIANTNGSPKQLYDDLNSQNRSLSKTSHELKNVFISVANILKNLNASPSLSPEEKEEFEFLSVLCDYGLSLILDINTTDRIDYTVKRHKYTSMSSLTINNLFKSPTGEDYESYNLLNSLSFCIKMFQVRKHFDNKNINIVLDYQIKNETTIKHIPSLRLRQVVINLLSNAYKFTFRGEIRLTCAYTSQGKVRIKVSDTGTGISESYMKFLFEPYQVDSFNQKMNIQGSGLGLSIIKDILEAFDLSIECNSTIGKGTTFWFDVPVVDDSVFEIINPKNLITQDLMRIINEVNSGITLKESTINSYGNSETNGDIYEDGKLRISLLRQNNNKNTKLSEDKISIYSCKTANKILFKNKFQFHSYSVNNGNNLISSKQGRDITFIENLTSIPYLTRCYSNPDIFHKSQKKHFITNTKKYNIFICDDERQMALSTKNLFMKYFKSKYNEDSLPEIFIVNDGIQCLYQAYQFYLEDNQCNLIIMDQNMNFMNGDVACRIIKQTKQLENIAVYLITSDDASYFTSCNANGVFSKPITASHIETILHKQFFD